MASKNTSSPLSKISHVRIPGKPSSKTWDISIEDGRIAAVVPHDKTADISQPGTLDGCNRLVAPSLCHAHVHLDKCFLLQDPKYSDLQIESGDFKEAMEMTGEAKSRFEEDDLLRRGQHLIDESIRYGVTAMRAFVEVDGIVQLKCLYAGLKLREENRDRCEIQICAFAQLPLFSGEDDGAKVRQLITEAAGYADIEVLGSTPYVEDNEEKSRKNSRWIAKLALDHGKHLDLHLDYFLEAEKQPLVWTVIEQLKELSWQETGNKKVTFGHCTRLTRFQKEEWSGLRHQLGDLPVSFVGLPTSDLFMMRTQENVRGTLPIVELIEKHGLNAAISINNVGNAFTPQGSCDALRLAELGVGLYQAGTKKDADVLYEAISSRAKAVIGCDASQLSLMHGQPADLVLFDKMDSGWRCRRGISDVVYDPPSTRQTVFRGRVTGSNQ